MSVKGNNIETLKKAYEVDLNRLERMVRNMHSVSDIRFIYNYLSTIEVDVTHEFIMLSEALTAALTIGYGRLFTQTDGVTKLNEDVVPNHLRPIHDEIIKLRHTRYAHHGADDSIKVEMNVQEQDGAFIVSPQLSFKLCFGAPKEWAPLFEWVDSHMFEVSKKQLAHLSKISGVEWRMADGPSPYWRADSGREVDA